MKNGKKLPPVDVVLSLIEATHIAIVSKPLFDEKLDVTEPVGVLGPKSNIITLFAFCLVEPDDKRVKVVPKDTAPIATTQALSVVVVTLAPMSDRRTFELLDTASGCPVCFAPE